MRLLLDEMLDLGLVEVLKGLGHQADHVVRAGLAGASDFELAEYAANFDAFITLDLHRQEAEWVAVNEALMRGDIRVVRIRLPSESSNTLLDVTRSLIYRMESWIARLEAGCVLVTIRSLGTVDAARTREEVGEMLNKRRR